MQARRRELDKAAAAYSLIPAPMVEDDLVSMLLLLVTYRREPAVQSRRMVLLAGARAGRLSTHRDRRFLVRTAVYT